MSTHHRTPSPVDELRPLKTDEMTVEQMLIQYAARIRKAYIGDNPIADSAKAREPVLAAIQTKITEAYEKGKAE